MRCIRGLSSLFRTSLKGLRLGLLFASIIAYALTWSVDAGKSTMLGVLVKGDLDDGRGKARVNLFRHKHEIESGRTSSVGMEIMGFDTNGDVVSSTVPGRKLSWEEIGNRSVSLLGCQTASQPRGNEICLLCTVLATNDG